MKKNIKIDGELFRCNYIDLICEHDGKYLKLLVDNLHNLELIDTSKSMFGHLWSMKLFKFTYDEIIYVVWFLADDHFEIKDPPLDYDRYIKNFGNSSRKLEGVSLRSEYHTEKNIRLGVQVRDWYRNFCKEYASMFENIEDLD